MAFLRMEGSRVKKRPVRRFTRVKNLEFEKDGTVEEFLDSQFTVNYEDGSFGFLFYSDKGDTWRPLDEPKKGDATMVRASACGFGNKTAGAGKVNWGKVPPMWATEAQQGTHNMDQQLFTQIFNGGGPNDTDTGQ